MTAKLTCAHCGAQKTYNGHTQRGIIDDVRSQNGVITRDNVYYCPKCGANRRHVGRGGANKDRHKLADGVEQLGLF